MASAKSEAIKLLSHRIRDRVRRWQLGVRSWFQAEFEQAYFYYVRARAEKGDSTNEYRLGLIYECGQYGLRSDYQAHKWFLRAAFQGLAEAQAKVSEFHQCGRGVAKNDEEAFKWCRKAAEQGHVPSQIRLAQMYQDGFGVERNPVEAKKWYNRVAEKHHGPVPVTLTRQTSTC